METLFATLHVVAAVFIVGPMAILPMTAMRAIRAGQGQQVDVLARSTFVFSLLSLVVVVFGFGILPFSKYGTTVTTPWVLASLIIYVIALALSIFGVVPALRSAAEQLAAIPAGALPGPDTAAVTRRAYGRVAMFSGIASLLLVVIVVLMAWKP
ncbi:DUF2269 family protein [Nakamurella sp.]|uniref:DUF2269 family protein n=1 Tax=Nakamurella sp. TaxID=1869182 RepID=UPI0037836012